MKGAETIIIRHLLSSTPGNMELEETLYMWKTKSHVMKYFKEPYELEQEAKKHDFLHSFMAGPNRLPTWFQE